MEMPSLGQIGNSGVLSTRGTQLPNTPTLTLDSLRKTTIVEAKPQANNMIVTWTSWLRNQLLPLDDAHLSQRRAMHIVQVMWKRTYWPQD